MTNSTAIWRAAIALTLLFVVATGFLFPLLIWGIGQAAFPHQANGSMVRDGEGQIIGSALIGQNFAKPEYFHPRPSAAGSGYDGANSSGTNLGPLSDKLINGIHDPKNPSGDFDGIADLAKKYRDENGLPDDALVPADAVTRSASGLDPDISVANAVMQADRVARVRGIAKQRILALIDNLSEGAEVLANRRVNVLELNRRVGLTD